MPESEPTPLKRIVPAQIGEQNYLSISYGVLWALAGAMFVGLGLMCVGVREGQQFIDDFNTFEKRTLAYQRDYRYDKIVIDTKLSNIYAKEDAADIRRKTNSPSVVTQDTLEDTLRNLQSNNDDVLHTDGTRHGLVVPQIVMKPLVTFPEATILPIPTPPADYGLDPTL